MMGGSRYDKYFNENLVNDPNKILEFTLNSLRKQIKFDINPKSYKVSVLKVIKMNNISRYFNIKSI
jgi:hypothetical protein